MKTTSRGLFSIMALFAFGSIALADADCASVSVSGNMKLAEDCKAFDGNLGGVSDVKVCVNGETSAFLITDSSGHLTIANETSHQLNGTTITFVAGTYALELPASPSPNGVFDAVFDRPVSPSSVPLVCTLAP